MHCFEQKKMKKKKIQRFKIQNLEITFSRENFVFLKNVIRFFLFASCLAQLKRSLQSHNI